MPAAADDDLRLRCVNYPRVGGWRALSLWDVALAFERAGASMDWVPIFIRTSSKVSTSSRQTQRAFENQDSINAWDSGSA